MVIGRVNAELFEFALCLRQAREERLVFFVDVTVHSTVVSCLANLILRFICAVVIFAAGSLDNLQVSGDGRLLFLVVTLETRTTHILKVVFGDAVFVSIDDTLFLDCA